MVQERRSSFRTIAVLTLLPIAGLLLYLGWLQLRERVPSLAPAVKPAPQPRVEKPQPVPAHAPPFEAKALPKPPVLSRKPGSIVLIIDDVGFEGQPIDRAMQLDPNVNFAILPNSPRAAEFATRLDGRGFEVLCHLPMEPVGKESPGRNAILTSMADDQIAELTRSNLAAVPHARGVNNHMGSRATADRRVMESVIGALPGGMYFIDSRTGGHSVAQDVAREKKVKTAARHVFLDDVLTEEAVRRQLMTLARAARTRGVAIGIGHPHDVTLRVLAETLPELRAGGIRLVRASDAVQ